MSRLDELERLAKESNMVSIHWYELVQIINLVRLQNAALKANTVISRLQAVEAFDKFERGE